ncbi:MAG: hypothetical protein HKL82_11825 [Acidimicrobiaceae bacterium]|nr:hypothetical protein [Acidimicrobiaceae bacterium]
MDREELDKGVIELFAMVGDSFAGATEALLSGDKVSARSIVSRDLEVDHLYREIETSVTADIIESDHSPEYRRYLIVVLRMISELERSGDLAEHIARRALLGISEELTPRCRGIIDQMGDVGVTMWRKATDTFADRDSKLISVVEALDDELDDLHVAFASELVGCMQNVAVAMELALVARFYERFGDHAVNLSRSVRSLSGP